MIVIDATALMLFVSEHAPPPSDAEGRPVPLAAKRVRHLIQELETTGTMLVVPTPALAEVLVQMDPLHAQEVVRTLSRAPGVRVEAFDERAALEVAAMGRVPRTRTPRLEKTEVYAKLKYDRQIAAIAKVLEADEVLTDDQGLRRTCVQLGLAVRGVADLPIPPAELQTDAFEDA